MFIYTLRRRVCKRALIGKARLSLRKECFFVCFFWWSWSGTWNCKYVQVPWNISNHKAHFLTNPRRSCRSSEMGDSLLVSIHLKYFQNVWLPSTTCSDIWLRNMGITGWPRMYRKSKLIGFEKVHGYHFSHLDIWYIVKRVDTLFMYTYARCVKFCLRLTDIDDKKCPRKAYDNYVIESSKTELQNLGLQYSKCFMKVWLWCSLGNARCWRWKQKFIPLVH